MKIERYFVCVCACVSVTNECNTFDDISNYVHQFHLPHIQYTINSWGSNNASTCQFYFIFICICYISLHIMQDCRWKSPFFIHLWLEVWKCFLSLFIVLPKSIKKHVNFTHESNNNNNSNSSNNESSSSNYL